MGYEQQFLEVRKGYHQKIQTFQPSKALMAIIDEDKPKQLAHKLDENKDKPYRDMDQALNIFDAYRLAYIKKITDAIAHESQATKIRPTINLLMAKLEKMCDDFQKECDARRKADINLAKAKAADAKNLTDDVKKVGEEYKKRGEEYQSKASKFEKDFLLAQKLIKEMYEKTRKDSSLIDKMPPDDLKKLNTKRQAALKQIKDDWEKLKKSFKELEHLAQTDSKLTPEDLGKEMRMKLDGQEAKLELAKAHKESARYFSRATEIFNDVNRNWKMVSGWLKDTEMWANKIAEKAPKT